jgi:predicted RNase H-like HicB family nuclease
MRNIIQFSITKEGKWYTAVATGAPIVTQGKTLEEVQKNIQEAVEVYLHGEDVQALGFAGRPSLLANFEIPVNA